jgi:Pyruvate/2-oxoacid:ferredoxin oxidoreductase delta subunit
MTLSRKDFFRQSFFSLGETLLKVGGTVQELQDSLCSPPVDVEPEREPVPDGDTVAGADNQYCLAKNCGCFSCVERCDDQAISVVMGEGISIDEARCTGCGTCEYVCPVTPKALHMKRKKQVQIT